jgi:hypothetical protein
MSKDVPKTAAELRNRLAVLFSNQESGFTKHAEAKELNNTAGKMIATAKIELERKVFLKDKETEIPFLDD